MNPFTDLSPLAKLTKLGRVDLAHTQYRTWLRSPTRRSHRTPADDTPVETSPVAKLEDSRSWCSEHRVKNCPARRAQELKSLDLRGAPVKDTSPVDRLTGGAQSVGSLVASPNSHARVSSPAWGSLSALATLRGQFGAGTSRRDASRAPHLPPRQRRVGALSADGEASLAPWSPAARATRARPFGAPGPGCRRTGGARSRLERYRGLGIVVGSSRGATGLWEVPPSLSGQCSWACRLPHLPTTTLGNLSAGRSAPRHRWTRDELSATCSTSLSAVAIPWPISAPACRTVSWRAAPRPR